MKVWLRFPADNKQEGFSTAVALLELVQQKGTEEDDSFKIQPSGMQYICFSVPDVYSTVHRLQSLEIEMVYLSPKQCVAADSDIAVVRDPNGYAIQLITQELDKHEELAEVCREIVIDGAEHALEEITEESNPETLAEAGVKTPSPPPPQTLPS